MLIRILDIWDPPSKKCGFLTHFFWAIFGNYYQAPLQYILQKTFQYTLTISPYRPILLKSGSHKDFRFSEQDNLSMRQIHSENTGRGWTSPCAFGAMTWFSAFKLRRQNNWQFNEKIDCWITMSTNNICNIPNKNKRTLTRLYDTEIRSSLRAEDNSFTGRPSSSTK